jgi:hypothetical protein
LRNYPAIEVKSREDPGQVLDLKQVLVLLVWAQPKGSQGAIKIFQDQRQTVDSETMYGL